MAVVGDTLPHCTGTGTSADPYKYSTAQGFKEAIAVSNSYVEAAIENLIFDVNDGVLSNLIRFYCVSLDGKGTTIKNLYSDKANNVIIGTCVHGHVYKNINFYNMLIIATGTTGAQANFFHTEQPNGGSGGRFEKCNFTGVYVGTNIDNATIRLFDCSRGGGIYAPTTFKDCTFNLSFKLTKVRNDDAYIFDANSSYDGAVLNNCTVCVSGTFNVSVYNGTLYMCRNITTNNCTFTNNSANPLTIGDARLGINFSPLSGSGANYVKMYINHTDPSSNSTFSCSSNAANFLINKSRITGYTTISGGIQMQETDPSLDTYIYDATNLAAKGFLVGTVIQ